jgi:Mrp family chromosome partitioning ATPase/uncharacterized protein involved in exopolysaccharide biosynthesis
MATTASTDLSTSALPGRGIKPLDSLLNHTRLVIVTFVLVMLVGLPVVFIKGVSTYLTTATIQVAPRYMKNLKDDNELDFQSNSQYRQFVEQQTKTINRYDILQKALSSLNTPEGTNPWTKSGEKERRAIERLQRSLRIIPIPDTYLIQIALESTDKEGLDRVVNAVVNTYLSSAKDEQVYGANERVDQLRAREAELGHANAALTRQRSEIARQLGVTAFNPADGNPYDKLVQRQREGIAEARGNRIEAEAKLAAFSMSGETDLVTRSVLESVLIDPGLNSLKSTLNKRRGDLVTMLSGLAPTHPTHQAAQQELMEIDAEINKNNEELTKQVRDGLLKRYETAVEQTRRVEAGLKQALETSTLDSEAYAARFNHAVTLTSDMEQIRKEIETVRERLNFFAIESTSLGFVRPVMAALPADLPMGAGKKKLFLLLLVAAMGLALVVPIAVDVLDPHVKTINDAHRGLGFAPLGWLIDTTDSDSSQFANDQLRRMASALIRDQDRHGTQAIALTGVKPGAGTTYLVRELTTTLNQLGVPTLAVNANAFAPSTAYGDGPGLQALLNDATATPDIRMVGGIPSLSVGDEVKGRQLNGLDGLGAVVKRLTAEFRFVLIDAPPLLTSSDSELIVRATGAAITVVEADGITKGELARATKLLEKLDPPSLGAVVNRIQPFRGGGYIQSLIAEHLSGHKEAQQPVSHGLRMVWQAMVWDALAMGLRLVWKPARFFQRAKRTKPTDQ